MGAAVRFDDTLLARAVGASLVLHLLAAFFLPRWSPPESSGLQPIEALSFAHLMRVQIERPAVAAVPSAAPKTDNLAKRITLTHSRAEISAKTHAARSVRPAHTSVAESEKAAAPRKHSHQTAAPLIAQAPASSAPAASLVSQSKSTPIPESSDTRSVESNGSTDRGGVMPPGYYSPPVLDPGVRSQIAKLAAAHVTLTVVVGEDGKTKSIAFAPPLDAATEDSIRSMLASAAWDPAVCGGGVSCEGTAVIRL